VPSVGNFRFNKITISDFKWHSLVFYNVQLSIIWKEGQTFPRQWNKAVRPALILVVPNLEILTLKKLPYLAVCDIC
jgi:hypothetical protein